MNSIRIQLLNELITKGDSFVSGEDLSSQLKVSRTAIWKHIKELKKEGYAIEAVRNQGYRIVSVPNTLSTSTILPYLETKWLGQNLVPFEEVKSTQFEAQRLAIEGARAGTLVIADQQKGGKGRMGRKWYSPPGSGVWMSLILRPDIPFSVAPQLTLLASVAVLRGISELTTAEIGIKWPNDIMLNHKKVAGILTEMSAETDRINHVIIGVGINVNQQLEDFPEELRSIATSIRNENGLIVNRSQLIIRILKEWEELYELYVKHGFSPIKTLWETYAISLGRHISARTLQGRYEGYAKGITDEGVLLLEDPNGTVHKIYSADLETS